MNRTQEAYDRWARTYDTDRNPQTAMEEADVLALVAPSAGERILDAGCGTGRYCRLFRELQAYVIGVDFSDSMLAIARKALPDIEFHRVNLTKPLPFAEGTFDKINCAQTLKHLADLGPTLKEFTRTLRPDGTITFSVAHPDMNWENYDLSYTPSFILSQEADIYPHRFCDYFEAITQAGLTLATFRQIPVDDRIKGYLAPESFAVVKGRYQVAIFHLRKEVEPLRSPNVAERAM